MELDKGLSPYFQGERIVAIPRRRAARLAVLDLVANRFEPGLKYAEVTVNAVLGEFHADFCALRRYLVDEGFLDRSDPLYWRAGGTVEVD